MEPDKAFNEALFRSHPATEKANQAQSQLYNMGTASQQPHPTNPSGALHPELNESSRNLMQSWHTLRKLDEDLAEKMSEKGKTHKPKPKMK